MAPKAAKNQCNQSHASQEARRTRGQAAWTGISDNEAAQVFLSQIEYSNLVHIDELRQLHGYTWP